MKFLANENFPIKSILYLKDNFFDVTSTGMNNPSIKDSEVMSIAVRENRTILTFDRDYGELIFKHNYKPAKGVIYFRLDRYKPDEPGKLIEDLINRNDYNFDNALTVI